MKTVLFSFITASLLAIASIASNGSIGITEVVATFFATGLVAWTIAQYSAPIRTLGGHRKTMAARSRPVVRHPGVRALPHAA